MTQALLSQEPVTFSKPAAQGENTNKGSRTSPMVYGIHKFVIKTGLWVNIFWCALRLLKTPLKATKALKRLKDLRDSSRGENRILKYAKVNNKYFYSSNAPGWPSPAFDEFITNNLKELLNDAVNVDTMIFGITKKCGYKCEHCYEWDALNKPETLTREALLHITATAQKLGVTQIQLSGGEPLNRFDDIIFLLKSINRKTEVWLYTSGYRLTEDRAALLKANGLTGITVSLDHWIPEMHNQFRGKKFAFEWVEAAVTNAVKNNLVACLSLCATRNFLVNDNLWLYAEQAKNWGVSFIQLLEPRAVGHYAGKDVGLSSQQLQQLEDFYTTCNFDKRYRDYPSVVYHGYYSRRIGCGGSGRHYLYVDTDGDVHNCPFCQRKLFSALDPDMKKNLRLMSDIGCTAFSPNAMEA